MPKPHPSAAPPGAGPDGDAPAIGDEPATQQAAPRQAQAAPKPAAETQTLAGQKSNPSTGWSLGGMFESAANAVGLGNDDPAPAAARPAPRAAHTP